MIARSDAQSQEARSEDNHDQDADDVENVHWALRAWHARASDIECAPEISLAAERSSNLIHIAQGRGSVAGRRTCKVRDMGARRVCIKLLTFASQANVSRPSLRGTPSRFKRCRVHPNPEENFMRTMFYGLLAVAAIAIATPASAQLRIETPVGGVRVGTDRHYDRDYDRPRHRGTTGYSERSYDSGCRTITIRRDDGSVRKSRRCD